MEYNDVSIKNFPNKKRKTNTKFNGAHKVYDRKELGVFFVEIISIWHIKTVV